MCALTLCECEKINTRAYIKVERDTKNFKYHYLMQKLFSIALPTFSFVFQPYFNSAIIVANVILNITRTYFI